MRGIALRFVRDHVEEFLDHDRVRVEAAFDRFVDDQTFFDFAVLYEWRKVFFEQGFCDAEEQELSMVQRTFEREWKKRLEFVCVDLNRTFFVEFTRASFTPVLDFHVTAGQRKLSDAWSNATTNHDQTNLVVFSDDRLKNKDNRSGIVPKLVSALGANTRPSFRLFERFPTARRKISTGNFHYVIPFMKWSKNIPIFYACVNV